MPCTVSRPLTELAPRPPAARPSTPSRRPAPRSASHRPGRAPPTLASRQTREPPGRHAIHKAPHPPPLTRLTPAKPGSPSPGRHWPGPQRTPRSGDENSPNASAAATPGARATSQAMPATSHRGGDHDSWRKRNAPQPEHHLRALRQALRGGPSHHSKRARDQTPSRQASYKFHGEDAMRRNLNTTSARSTGSASDLRPQCAPTADPVPSAVPQFHGKDANAPQPEHHLRRAPRLCGGPSPCNKRCPQPTPSRTRSTVSRRRRNAPQPEHHLRALREAQWTFLPQYPRPPPPAAPGGSTHTSERTTTAGNNIRDSPRFGKPLTYATSIPHAPARRPA